MPESFGRPSEMFQKLIALKCCKTCERRFAAPHLTHSKPAAGSLAVCAKWKKHLALLFVWPLPGHSYTVAREL